MYGMFGPGRGIGFMLRHGDEQVRPQVSRALLRRVLRYARPYARRIALLLFIIIITIAPVSYTHLPLPTILLV